MDILGVTAFSIGVSAGKEKPGTCSRALLFHINNFYYCDLMSPRKSFAHAIEWGPRKSASNRAPRLLRPALDVGTTKRRKWDQLSKRITFSLRSTKIAKFQWRKCTNVLRLQWMVSNRETSSAIAVFTGFSLCSVLQTFYLCSPNCFSGWTKRDVLATKVDPHFAPATALEPPLPRFLYWCC